PLTCNAYAWLNAINLPEGGYFELEWPAPVTIRSFYIDTAIAAGSNVPCDHKPGKNVAGASVDYWDGAAWVTATTFFDKKDDFVINLPSPVTTTKLRLYDVTIPFQNWAEGAVIYEWYVYDHLNCTPPP